MRHLMIVTNVRRSEIAHKTGRCHDDQNTALNQENKETRNNAKIRERKNQNTDRAHYIDVSV